MSACRAPSTNLPTFAEKYPAMAVRQQVCALALPSWRAPAIKPPAPPEWASSPLGLSAPPSAPPASFFPPPTAPRSLPPVASTPSATPSPHAGPSWAYHQPPPSPCSPFLLPPPPH